MQNISLLIADPFLMAVIFALFFLVLIFYFALKSYRNINPDITEHRDSTPRNPSMGGGASGHSNTIGERGLHTGDASLPGDPTTDAPPPKPRGK